MLYRNETKKESDKRKKRRYLWSSPTSNLFVDVLV